MSFIEFLLQYYVYILVVLVILIIGVIGFLVDSKNRDDNASKEVKKKSKKNKKDEVIESIDDTNVSSVDVVASLDNNISDDSISTDLEAVNQSSNMQVNNGDVLKPVEDNTTSNLLDGMVVSEDKKLENVPMSEVLNSVVDAKVISNSNVMPELTNAANDIPSSVSVDNVTTDVSSLNMGQNVGMGVKPEPLYANNVNSIVNDGLVYNQGINNISSVNQPINVGGMPVDGGNVNNVGPVINTPVNSFGSGQVNYTNNASMGVNSNVMNQNIGVMSEPVNLNNGMVQNITPMSAQVVSQAMPIAVEPVNFNGVMPSMVNGNVGIVSSVMPQGVNYNVNGNVQQMQPVSVNAPINQVTPVSSVNASVESQVVSNPQNNGVVVTTDGSQPFDIASMFANNNQ